MEIETSLWMMKNSKYPSRTPFFIIRRVCVGRKSAIVFTEESKQAVSSASGYSFILQSAVSSVLRYSNRSQRYGRGRRFNGGSRGRIEIPEY